MKELQCLDMTYLMEQRFRYTHIRDELELPHLASKYRRKCGKCLKISKGELSEDSDEEKQDSGRDTENRNVTRTEGQEELDGDTLQMMDSGEDTEDKDDDVGQTEAEEELIAGTSQMIDSERIDQRISGSQGKKKKPRRKKKKCKDLDVLKRFWFKREYSPPPKDELEGHLNELRIRTRKEIHTLIFLTTASVSISFIL
ncbi:hypothetical protein LOAG_13104 [Loa loa]|uniref:Uncharacterized protein n=1 Tax=Loa loa TaxID=7209 RepID=A0A1S0TJW5_LOALO|nr:hypothetical protein LOAG_13104 [Loa loa]EFO15407.2 hypothetical protein LOAG_13104 [Loa loa]